MMKKIIEVIKNVNALVLAPEMSLKHKLAYLVSLPFSPITKTVIWFGHLFVTDNRLGSFLLPGYIREVANLKAIVGELKEVLILDIGANVGQFACTTAAITNWQIHSFEPNKKIYEMLLANTQHNHVQVNNFGIGAISSQDDLYFIEGKSAQGSTSKEFAKKGLRGNLNSVVIQLVTIEDYLTRLALNKSLCLVMKVDVEGMEMQVMEQLGSFHFDVVQLEFTPSATSSLESFIEQASQHLSMDNPALYDLESDKGNSPRNIIFKN
jgi:FkbM family methyltransferase